MHTTFDEVIEEYVTMNIAPPFAKEMDKLHAYGSI